MKVRRLNMKHQNMTTTTTAKSMLGPDEDGMVRAVILRSAREAKKREGRWRKKRKYKYGEGRRGENLRFLRAV